MISRIIHPNDKKLRSKPPRSRRSHGPPVEIESNNLSVRDKIDRQPIEVKSGMNHAIDLKLRLSHPDRIGIRENPSDREGSEMTPLARVETKDNPSDRGGVNISQPINETRIRGGGECAGQATARGNCRGRGPMNHGRAIRRRTRHRGRGGSGEAQPTPWVDTHELLLSWPERQSRCPDARSQQICPGPKAPQ